MLNNQITDQTMCQVLVAMLGARRHYAVPRALNEVNSLYHFYTDICATKGYPRLLNLVPKSLQPAPIRRLSARIPIGIPDRKHSAFTNFGISNAIKYSAAKTLDDQIEVFKSSGQIFSNKILKKGFGNADAIYIFDHNGIDLVRKAKAKGLKAVYDVTVAPLSVDLEYIEAERIAFPAWESEDLQLKAETIVAYNQRDREIWEAADILICGSDYVKQKVVSCGGKEDKCRVVPYGIEYEKFNKTVNHEKSYKLRVLTVGTVSLRKGAPYILEVARKLGNYADFKMVGSVKVEEFGRKQLEEAIDVTGPVPRSEINKYYEWADVFLLPSLNEGSAAVTYEALASGLPVICTPNTGSVVRDGIDGYVVEPRDIDAIEEKLMQLYSSNKLLKEMSENAKQRVMEFSPRHYGKRLIQEITTS